MMQQVLNGTLCPRHREAGLSLIEKDGDIELLSEKLEPIKSWPGIGVLIQEIITTADNYLIDSHIMKRP